LFDPDDAVIRNACDRGESFTSCELSLVIAAISVEVREF
jgi:hypothetical protein